MKYALITLTEGGVCLAKKIREEFPQSEIFALETACAHSGDDVQRTFAPGTFSGFLGEIFNAYGVLIFIMAAGIVVRTIAPYLKDKTTDPGVLVIDEKGQFVISLLSGHIGGANEAACLVAEKINATPVITTSSDVNNVLSVDMIALKYNCVIDNMEKAKKITALLVNKKKVFLWTDMNIPIPDYFTNDEKGAEGTIYLANKKREPESAHSVFLIPKNIIIGIGCKRDTKKDHLISVIKQKLAELNIDERAIKCVSTIDVKKDEQAIINAAEYFTVPLRIISSEKIKEVESNFNGSDFVKSAIGVASVCEPCAYLASNGSGKMISAKTKYNGVTIAVWEE
ncbi:MAG: cobalt-precorrin 5A hydrolase [bacterium]|nr:cobalt-precorrin 5A hydrolase [bacterium]